MLKFRSVVVELTVIVPVETEHDGCAVALAVGALGAALTTGVVVPAELVQPLTVTVTEYSPAIAVVADALTVGF